MATATQDVTRRNYIQVVPNTGVAGIPFSRGKERWMVLYKGSTSSPGRLELYQNEDETTPQMSIHLDAISSVVKVEGRKEFVIFFAGSQVIIACKANAEVQDWISDINNGRGVDDGTTHTSNGMAVCNTYPGDDVFVVRLRRSQVLTFHGACILEIEKIIERNEFYISLFTKRSPRRLIAKWLIDHIRKYGSTENVFTFESGSRSSTGEGLFVMDTKQGVAGRIERVVDYWVEYATKNNQSGRTQVTSPTPSAMPSLYKNFDQTKLEQLDIYDYVETKNPANISQGQYQAIHPASFSSPPPQENEYHNLDPSGRESTTEEVATPSTVIPPRDCAALHKTGTQGQYMKLNPDTRDQVEPSYYMEMTASHPKGHRHLI